MIFEPSNASTVTDGSNNGKRKQQQRAQSIGKRNKALGDKVDRLAPLPGKITGQEVTVLSSSITSHLDQMTSHTVEQLNFANWSDVKRE
jgi:hypothetical protein